MVVSAKLTVLSYLVVVALLIVALMTDALDGWLARKWRVTSDRGYILDAMGDRAVHLALILVIVTRYSVHPIFAWLLIFRDISIYAVRVLSRNWQRRSKEWRWLSLLHATNVRIWIGLFMVRDGVHAFTGHDSLDTLPFAVTQTTLLVATIVLSYYGLARSFNWMLDREHEDLQSMTHEG